MVRIRARIPTPVNLHHAVEAVITGHGRFQDQRRSGELIPDPVGVEDPLTGGIILGIGGPAGLIDRRVGRIA